MAARRYGFYFRVVKTMFLRTSAAGEYDIVFNTTKCNSVSCLCLAV